MRRISVIHLCWARFSYFDRSDVGLYGTSCVYVCVYVFVVLLYQYFVLYIFPLRIKGADSVRMYELERMSRDKERNNVNVCMCGEFGQRGQCWLVP